MKRRYKRGARDHDNYARSDVLKFVEEAMEQIIYQIVLERKNDHSETPLAQVIYDLDLDVNRIALLSDSVEEE